MKKWVVVSIPSAYNLTQVDREFNEHYESGLYLQLDLSQELLKHIKAQNEEVLATIPVNAKLYGKINQAGIHDDEPDPVPNLFDERRKVYFHEYKKFLYEEEIANAKESQITQSERMSDKLLRQPSNLLQIVELGIENKTFSQNAVAELFEQLYNLEDNM